MSRGSYGLIAVCGATATGKSGLALALAQELGTVILSADSRQVYREFDIGTAKPTRADRLLVSHYLIDICDPRETLTLASYQQLAQGAIASFQERGCIPLLVGGTGLYLRSVVQGMKIPRVAPHTELRSQLEELSQKQCYGMLQQVDPGAARKIHANDALRTLRALEVFYVTGREISQQQGTDPPNYPIVQIGLECADPDRLRQRIAQRTEQMLAAGFVEEVEYLTQKYGADLPLLDTLGYQEIKQYLAGDIQLSEAKELTILHTRQFAKRQRTWFRGDRQIEWFDADSPNLLEIVWQRVQEFRETL